jgi:S1-C subfamily serine protease
MPEILAPGTGLSPLSDKSTIPYNNVHTIQDVLNGKPYKVPGSGGNWSEGEDTFKSYKEDGEDYKRDARDLEIINRVMSPSQKSKEVWKVKTEGGSKTFDSFELAQEYESKLREKGIRIEWKAKVKEAQENIDIIADSMSKCFMIQSLNFSENLKETGSCFCVAPNIFMTCAHVLRKYDKTTDLNINLDSFNNIKIFIYKDGQRYEAKVVAIDAPQDIALVSCNLECDPFEFQEEIKIGDEILTIGSPHGYENNVSFGNVNSLNRKIFDHSGAPEYLFVDSVVFSGNSGGPVINSNTGKVIAMITAIAASDGEYGLNAGLPSKNLKDFCIINNINI